MSDDSEIEDKRRKQKMSSKRSKGKGKRSLSTSNEKGAKRRRLEAVGKKETSTDKTKTSGKPYGCQLCETAFNNVSSRNGHYSGKHKVHDEKLLFFPNGTGLVESSLEHQISLKPDWFKAAVRSKRRSTVCKLCEVDLDTEDHLKLHYKDIHKVTRMSVLSELIRLKNTDIKKVAVTHKCSSCTVSFDEAQELELHMKSAHDADFKRCDYCNIRVQIDVYKAHIEKKHADMIDKRVESRRSVVEVPEPKPKQVKREKKVKAVKKVETPKREVNKDKVKKTKDQKVADCCSKLVPAAKRTALSLYLCKACRLATASYDNAVSHAQDHILNIPNATNHCEICKLNFAADFDKHKKLHLTNEDLDADSFRLFPYDYRLLMSHKWFDMFVNTSKTMANKVRSASIYFPSRCIRLKIQKESQDPSERFTLFMCVTCNKYVDPPSIELHVEQQGDCSNQLSCYLCYQCQRQFFSQKARDQHSSTHEIPDASKRYRTVLFNDRNDFISNKKLLQAGMNIIVTNNKRVNKNTTENNESSVETDIITVVNEALYKSDHVEKFENDVLNELYPTVTDNDVVADIYQCKCGLSFDRLEFLCKHWKICSPALKLVTKTCKCGLVFDKQNYDYHCTVHSNGFTTFTVNEVTTRVKNSIDVRHIKHEFMNTTKLNNSEIIYNGMEEDNVVREEDVNKDTQGRILQNLQVVNIANVKVEVAANNLSNERPTLSNHCQQLVNIENYQQSSNELGSAEYIIKTQAENKPVYEQFETYKVLISNDISNNVSQSELENEVAMDVTDANSVNEDSDVVDDKPFKTEIREEINTYDLAAINTQGAKADSELVDNQNKNAENYQQTSNEHDSTEYIDKTKVNRESVDVVDDVPDNRNVCSSFADENQYMVDTTMEIDLQQETYQDKNLLISNTKEQDSVESPKPVKDHVSPLLEENTLIDSVMKDIPHENVLHNANIVNEDSDVVEDKPFKTEIREETNTYDLAAINTQSAKADSELVDNQNKNAENYRQTSNEHDSIEYIDKTKANRESVDVVDEVPDNTNVCSSFADENQYMVDTTMDIDLQQETYQDKNLLISNTKEQDSVESPKPVKDQVSSLLEENKLSNSELKEISHENVLHNSKSVNKVSGFVEDMRDKFDNTEINIHEEATINIEGYKADVQFVDNKSRNTENCRQTRNEHDNTEFIGKMQANSQSVDREFEVDKVLISNDTIVSQTELENQVVTDIKDDSINIQNIDVPDNKKICNNNADEYLSVVDTSTEIDLQLEICQDKNLLISSTKKQARVENNEPEKDPECPSLQENEVRDSVMKENPQKNVIHNTNSVNEDSHVVEDKQMLLFKTDIREEGNTHDEAVINIQGAKADIEFVDSKNTENYQQISNKHEYHSVEYISKSQTNSQTADKEFEADKVLISNDTSNNVSQIELENQVVTDIKDDSINIQNIDVPDNKNSCNNNADENLSVVDTSTENDLQLEICQDKNSLISNTKEQARLDNYEPEIDPVSPSLLENEVSDNVIQGIPHENVIHNTNSVNEGSNVVDDKPFKTEIREETNTYDLAAINTQSAKADSELVDNQNKNAENYRQTSNENESTEYIDKTKANRETVDVADGVPDNKNVCSSNADENQFMVDTTMEIDLQQETYQDKNLLISNTKEQDSVESPKPVKDHVSPLLEENTLIDSVMKEIPHGNVLHNANIVNEDSDVVEDKPFKTEIREDSDTYDLAAINTHNPKADSALADNQNKNAENYEQTSNEHDSTEYIDKAKANRETVDVVDEVPDNTNVCSSFADENQYMVDTTMEIDLQQEMYQDKNLLISNTKEQDGIENPKLVKDHVSPLLEENKLIDSVMKEIPHENVPHNANIVNEGSDVVDDKPFKTEIREESDTYDLAAINTHNAKADSELVDNQNKNAENYQQTSNEHDSTEYIDKTKANRETVDVVDEVPDNTNACSSNADENQFMVDTTMEIDLQQETYEDKNVIISNTKEQDGVGNPKPVKDHVSPLLEENKLIDCVMKEIPHENVPHNANSVNEVSDVDETLETNTHDGAVINTQALWAKEADVEFLDGKNKHTERDDIKSNDNPKDKENEKEHIGTESRCAYTISVAALASEIVYSEEELLDGPEDPDVVDDSLLTDDEDL